MDWIKRILGMRVRRGGGSPPAQRNHMALDLPNDPGATRVQRPKVRGKTPEQRAADLVEYHSQLQAKGRAIFERDRASARLAGSVKYRWRACSDSDVCPRCAKNNGRLFSWDTEPAGGHPGCSTDCPGGSCRCYAEPVLGR